MNYNTRFKEITDHLTRMAELVDEELTLAQKSLGEADKTLHEQVRASDKKVNALNDETEKLIAKMFMMQNPMASDLRYILSAYKAAVSLERIGDIAKGVTKRMVRKENPLRDNVRVELSSLVEVDKQMINSAIKSFIEQTPDTATEVWRRDEEADNLCRRVFALVIAEMQKSPLEAHHMIDYLFAAKNFERVADYATGIAKTVHYVATGVRPKKSILENM
ncbi:MAG: phosphate signaling complex protein PhoU [Rickettsiales bacterium]